MLDKRVTDIESVEEKYQDLYAQDDSGDWVLQIVDQDAKKQVDEFRNNNRALNRELNALKEEMGKYSALGDLSEDDISALRDMQARQAAAQQDEILRDLLGDAGLDKDKLRQYAEKQFEGERKELNRAIDRLRAETEELEGRYTAERAKYQDEVRSAAIRAAVDSVARVRPGAMDDILARGRGSLGFDENQSMIVQDANGDVRYGKRGGDYMTVEEWASELVESAPHLFEGRVGGGASGDNSPRMQPGVRAVDGMNPEELGRNFKAILNGEAQVRDNLR